MNICCNLQCSLNPIALQHDIPINKRTIRINGDKINPSEQAIIPLTHNVSFVIRLFRFTIENITPVSEQIGPTIIISVQLYGAWLALYI